VLRLRRRHETASRPPFRRVREVGERLSHRDQVERGRLEYQVLRGHAKKLSVGAFAGACDGQHAVGKVDSDHRPRLDLGRHLVRDQAGAGAHVQRVLALLRLRNLDQAAGDPPMLPPGPPVVLRGNVVKEVDQMVDHLIG